MENGVKDGMRVGPLLQVAMIHLPFAAGESWNSAAAALTRGFSERASVERSSARISFGEIRPFAPRNVAHTYPVATFLRFL